MRKSNVEIVIKALIQERAVDLGLSYPVFLGEVGGHKLLCFDYSDECNPVCDLNVGSFIDVCNKLDEEKVSLIAANNALTEINRKGSVS